MVYLGLSVHSHWPMHPTRTRPNAPADCHSSNVGPATYTLKYNIMPYVGLLTYGEAARTEEPVPFPEVQSLQ